MILADLGAELSQVIARAITVGELPESVAKLTASGTWRPVPAAARSAARSAAARSGDGDDGYGSYATSLPFRLAMMARTAPGPLAALLAERLGATAWVSAARVTGGGYLTITVSAWYLAGLPARILEAGPAAARSEALAGTRLTAPLLPDLVTTPDWKQAWQSQRAALLGRLSQAAGAEVMFVDSQQIVATESTRHGRPGPVPAALAYYGIDAVRYALTRAASPAVRSIERQLAARLDLANPYVLIRHAHADAASALRWAAELGLVQAGKQEVARKTPGVRSASPVLTCHAPELRLLDAISWLPERVAAAARRRRPAELAAHLESIAGAWLYCRERCPALPFGGHRAPAHATGALALARLRLADATRASLATGLALLGMSASART